MSLLFTFLHNNCQCDMEVVLKYLVTFHQWLNINITCLGIIWHVQLSNCCSYLTVWPLWYENVLKRATVAVCFAIWWRWTVKEEHRPLIWACFAKDRFNIAGPQCLSQELDGVLSSRTEQMVENPESWRCLITGLAALPGAAEKKHQL